MFFHHLLYQKHQSNDEAAVLPTLHQRLLSLCVLHLQFCRFGFPKFPVRQALLPLCSDRKFAGHCQNCIYISVMQISNNLATPHYFVLPHGLFHQKAPKWLLSCPFLFLLSHKMQKSRKTSAFNLTFSGSI